MSQKKPFIIGITGGSGSGKTSFIREMRKRFSEEELCIISQDDYYHPREQQLTDDKGYKNFDLPGSIDSDAFANDIKLLGNGKTIHRKEYTFNNENVQQGPAWQAEFAGLFQRAIVQPYSLASVASTVLGEVL